MDYTDNTPVQKPAPVEAMSSRQMEEVKGMVFMAKQFSAMKTTLCSGS